MVDVLLNTLSRHKAILISVTQAAHAMMHKGASDGTYLRNLLPQAGER